MTDDPELRPPPPDRKGLQSLATQLGIICAGMVGLLNQTLYALIPCVLLMFTGETLRLLFRGNGLSVGMPLGLLFSSTLFAFISYGMGRGFGWVARYFGWM